MSRSNSGTKWKEVLGFDGYSSSRHSRNQSTSTSSSNEPSISSIWSPQLIYQPTLPSYPRLPRDITFFRSRNDILLSPSSPAPSPNDLKPLPAPPHLFYITIQQEHYPYPYPHSSNTTNTGVGRPDLILHSGPSEANTVLSYAKFHPLTGETELTLCPAPSKAVSANFSTLDVNLENFPVPHSRSNSTSTSSTSSDSSAREREREKRSKFHTETLTPSNGGLFSAEKHTFHHTLPYSSPPERERFEWRYSGGPFLRPGDWGRESGGLKLVRCETGDVVAVYAGLGEGGDRDKKRNPRGVVGMMRFLSGVGLRGLEGEWEVLAVMSILTVVERNRRAVRRQRKLLGGD